MMRTAFGPALAAIASDANISESQLTLDVDPASIAIVSLPYTRSYWALLWAAILAHAAIIISVGVVLACALTCCAVRRARARRKQALIGDDTRKRRQCCRTRRHDLRAAALAGVEDEDLISRFQFPARKHSALAPLNRSPIRDSLDLDASPPLHSLFQQRALRTRSPTHVASPATGVSPTAVDIDGDWARSRFATTAMAAAAAAAAVNKAGARSVDADAAVGRRLRSLSPSSPLGRPARSRALNAAALATLARPDDAVIDADEARLSPPAATAAAPPTRRELLALATARHLRPRPLASAAASVLLGTPPSLPGDATLERRRTPDGALALHLRPPLDEAYLDLPAPSRRLAAAGALAIDSSDGTPLSRGSRTSEADTPHEPLPGAIAADDVRESVSIATDVDHVRDSSDPPAVDDHERVGRARDERARVHVERERALAERALAERTRVIDVERERFGREQAERQLTAGSSESVIEPLARDSDRSTPAAPTVLPPREAQPTTADDLAALARNVDEWVPPQVVLPSLRLDEWRTVSGTAATVDAAVTEAVAEADPEAPNIL